MIKKICFKHKKYFLVSFVTFFLFFGLSSVEAATVYTSSSYSGTESGTEAEPYNTFNEAYNAASSGDTIDAHGTFTWSDAGETGDSSDYGFKIDDKDVDIIGHGASSTIFQSASTVDSSDRRVFTTYDGYSLSISSSTIRYGEPNNSGGCLYSYSGSSVTLNNSEVTGCKFYAGYGLAIYSLGDLTITNSSIYNNVDYAYNGLGMGIFFSTSTGNLVITNSSIYGNENTGGSSYGGGLYLSSGTATITNSTITGNESYYNGGIFFNSATAVLNLSNTIVAGNTIRYSSGSNYNIFKGASATLNNNGYNVIGASNGFVSTTGDWYDSDNDDVYILNGSSTTGTLNLNSGGGNLNESLNQTHTVAIYTNSIAINNATTTANNGVSIPALDQRGAGRSGATDIGAFEYNGSGLSSPSAPTTQAYDITYSSVELYTYTASWTNGNGSRRVAFMKEASTGTSTPADGTMYSASSVFGSGDQIDATGWYAIYDGTGTTVDITGLSSSTDYIIQVFEYHGVGTESGIVYLTSTSTDNPKAQASHTAATIYTNSDTGNDSTGDGTSGSPYKTFYKAYSEAISGDSIDASGTFDWDNGAGETGDVTSYGYRIQKNITINGHGASSTIFQSDSVIDSSNKRVFTIYDGYSFTVNSSTIRYGETDSTGWSGGCINSESGSNVTLNNSDIYGCRVYGGYGFGIYALGNLTLTNSALFDNIDSIYNGYGAGIYFSSSTGNLIITNSSIYNNQNTSGGADGGGGVCIHNGTATITNSTITNNLIDEYGGGVYISAGTLYLSNTIIAGNSADDYNDLFVGGSGTLVNNGYNVIGGIAFGFTSTTGDWYDSDNDDIFTFYGSSTTGTLNMSAEGALHGSLNQTHSISLYSDSVAINNATTTANNSISIPSLDQRRAGRSGLTDIGAFEFDGTGLAAISAPTTQASEVSFSSIIRTSMTIDWTNGNGSRRVAFMKQASSGTASPVDGTMYTASSVFASGQQIGSTGWYTIYDGTDTTVDVTGLTASTDYIIQIFEYNGEGVSDGTVYLTSTSTNNPNTQASYTPITIYVNSSTGDDSTGVGSSGSPYQSFHKAYTEYVDGDVFDMTGTFDWDNGTGESGDVSGYGYRIYKDITIIGHGASSTIFQPNSTIESSNKRIFTVYDGYSLVINSSTVRYGDPNSTGWNGGCLYGSAGSDVTINNSEVHSCKIYGGYGFGMNMLGNLTITNSAIYNNVDYVYNGYGAGIYFSSSTGNLILTNSTIYGNQNTAGGSDGGGGVYIGSGTAHITNCTITDNSIDDYGGGIGMSGSATLYLSNSIVAGNSADVYKDISVAGTFHNNGYNIIGHANSNFTSTTGDWTDQDENDVYELYGISTTGTLSLDSSAALNSSLNDTRTYALLADSIAINNATSTANNSISIPTIDQRGGTLAGAARDIGAFEYESLADVTDPILSSLSPVDNATGVGVDSTFTITFNEDIVTSTGNIVVYKTSDDSVVETIDVTGTKVTTSGSTALVINPSTTLDSEIEYYITIATTAVDDTSGNSYAGITASTTWSFTSADVDSPSVTSISSDKANNTYKAGEVIDIDIVFSEVVTSTGNITVTLETGDTDQTCTFSVINSTTGTCNYTVQAGDNSLDLNATLSGTITDGSGNSTTTLTASTDLATNKALVIDTTAPTATLSPLDGATSVSISQNLEITFNEDIVTSTGNFIIYKISDDTVVETIVATSTQLSISGAIATINPTSDFDYETEYYITIASTLFDDTVGNSYAGISASTTWSFTSADTPTCPTISNASTYNAYPTCGVATCSSGYTLTNGACVANSSGVATPVPVPTVGIGTADTVVPMGSTGDAGTISQAGTNIATYINTPTNFQTTVSNHGSYTAQQHTVEIIEFDLFDNIVTIRVSSEPQIIILKLEEIMEVDLDNDNIKDIKIKFEDVVKNRAELTVQSILEDLEEVSELEQNDYEGKLIKYGNSPKVYKVENSKKCWIVDEQAFNHFGYKWSDLFIIDTEIKFEDGKNIIKPSNNFGFSQNLEFGMVGDDVRELQKYLNNNGFLVDTTGVGSPGNESIYFGSLTQSALIKFQQSVGLPAYGYFGPMTRAVIQ
ncbi:MAG: hypothetical protein HOD54_04620 [Candidatus Magasanikbacteria bacterium]|jgi:hypothetical protein|nr:hypothetical protein [Candidatus Magasanikbacteria bacterium]MBT4315336.1 hypothetical protein [Candidatus Magasanikbacteria bacterium]MBT4547209.1 hypothetical protein [Candidatus Magasanikbacteria bacterium]